MIKLHRFFLASMLVITLVGCGREGDEVQLQEGDIDPTTQLSQKSRPRLLIVRNSSGQEVNISADCIAKEAEKRKMTEAQASNSAYVDSLIEACRAERETNRGAYGYSNWNLGISIGYLYGYYYGYGYGYGQNYGQNYGSNYNSCYGIYGSWGASWTGTQCLNYYYYPSTYGYYNYNNTNNCQYTGSSWWATVPTSCYRQYNTYGSNSNYGSAGSNYGYYY